MLELVIRRKGRMADQTVREQPTTPSTKVDPSHTVDTPTTTLGLRPSKRLSSTRRLVPPVVYLRPLAFLLEVAHLCQRVGRRTLGSVCLMPLNLNWTTSMLLVLDNYDSFTFNLVQYLGDLGADIIVVRNDERSVDEIVELAPDRVVVSPGPCTPQEAGVSVDLFRALGPSTPMLGVCLGHQALGEAFGGRTVRAERVMHGKTSPVRHSGEGIFQGIPSPFVGARYHSLITDATALPEDLLPVAWSGTDDSEATEVQAIRHREYPLWGVQFHPESLFSEHGKALLSNFLEL